MDTHRKILRAIATVGVFVLLARVLGAAREILFAARFGTGEMVDAYLLTSNIVSWPVAVWASTLTAIAVPIMVKSDVAHPITTAQFVARLSIIAPLAGVILAVLMFLALWSVSGGGILGLSQAAAAAMREMLVPLCMTLPLGLLIGVLSARLMSQQRHINTLLDGVPALCVALAVALIMPLTASELAWATVAGFGAQALLLARLVGQAPVVGCTALFEVTPQWRAFTNGLGYFLLGQLAVGAIGFIDPIMVASVGAGAIAAFGYANRILALALGLTATAVGRAVLPAFSELAHDPERLVHTAKAWIGALLAGGVVCAAIGWVSAPLIVRTLFERGQFTPADTEAVANILRCGLLQLPVYLGGIVAVQLLAAQGRHKEITRSGLINVVVKLVANVPMIAAFGVGGAMLATALMYAISFVVLTRAAFWHRGAYASKSS